MSVKIINNINKNMPSLVNKTGVEYEAIFGKVNFVPEVEIVNSEDYNCGAIANELEFAQGFIEHQIQQNDPDTIEDEYLDTVVNFFTTLERIFEETDEGLRNRFYALIRRNGSLKWMPKWSVREVFSYFFDRNNLYVVENPIETSENKIINGDFENMTGVEFDDWTRSESGLSTVTKTDTDMLVGDHGIDIYTNPGDVANIAQTITLLSTGWYKLEFFYKSDSTENIGFYLTVKRSSDNYVWEPLTKTWASSTSGITGESSPIYLLKEIYIKLEDTSDLTFIFSGRHVLTTLAYHLYIDQIKLGAIKTYPSIKVMAISVGSSSYSMAFWDNGDDPIGGLDYNYASFLDFEYLEGPGGQYTTQLYEDLLEKIKVAGTKAIFEIVTRSSET